jgi:hypothetical protein
MTQRAIYGRFPRRLDDLFNSLSSVERDQVRFLDQAEHDQAVSRSLNKFPAVVSGIDWRDAAFLEQRTFDDDLEAEHILRQWFDQYLSSDRAVSIFWTNLAVPAIELPRSIAKDHLDEIIAASFDQWFYGPESQLLIECYHEGILTAATIPD